jgi:hypothetical protein
MVMSHSWPRANQNGYSDRKISCANVEFVYYSLATDCTPVFRKVYTRGASAVGSRKWFLLATSFRAPISGAGE